MTGVKKDDSPRSLVSLDDRRRLMRAKKADALLGEVSLGAKVAFLSRRDTYSPRPDTVRRIETHMSWVFLVGDRVYKLKKPVRFEYLDYSTLDRREAACRAELSINRRLAPEVYLRVTPLTASRNAHDLPRLI